MSSLESWDAWIGRKTEEVEEELEEEGKGGRERGKKVMILSKWMINRLTLCDNSFDYFQSPCAKSNWKSSLWKSSLNWLVWSAFGINLCACVCVERRRRGRKGERKRGCSFRKKPIITSITSLSRRSVCGCVRSISLTWAENVRPNHLLDGTNLHMRTKATSPGCLPFSLHLHYLFILPFIRLTRGKAGQGWNLFKWKG